MNPNVRLTLRIAGFILVGLGAASLIFVLVSFATVASPSSAGEPGDFIRNFILFGFGGMFLLAAGSFCLQVGFLKVAADIVSTETAGAVEHSSAALGRGLRQGGVGGMHSSSIREVIKVRCPSCGALDSEDAVYCSSCGDSMTAKTPAKPRKSRAKKA